MNERFFFFFFRYHRPSSRVLTCVSWYNRLRVTHEPWFNYRSSVTLYLFCTRTEGSSITPSRPLFYTCTYKVLIPFVQRHPFLIYNTCVSRPYWEVPVRTVPSHLEESLTKRHFSVHYLWNPKHPTSRHSVDESRTKSRHVRSWKNGGPWPNHIRLQRCLSFIPTKAVLWQGGV